MEGQTDGWADDGRTDERTNKSLPVFYRTSSPSGPLPKKTDFRPDKTDFRPERTDSRPKEADFRPERV